MLIVFGSRNMGETDSVPGLFYVATRFFHFQYLPLVAEKSYLVLPALSNRVVEIPLSQKSIGVAWLRVITFSLHSGTLLWLMLGSIDDLDEGVWMALLFLGLSGIISASCVCGGHKLGKGVVIVLVVALVLGATLNFVEGSFEKTALPLGAFTLAGVLNVWSQWSKTTRYASYNRAMELCTYLGPRGGPVFQCAVNGYFQQQASPNSEFVAVPQAEVDDEMNGVELPVAVAERVVDIEAPSKEEPPVKAAAAENAEGVI